MISIRKLHHSFSYAFEGIRFALEADQNFRIHLITAFLVLLLGFYLQLSGLEMGILIVMIVLVICAELMNTALEKVIDLITKEHHFEAKFAKDVSSAMVLTTAIGSVIVGSIIFLPHLFVLIS